MKNLVKLIAPAKINLVLAVGNKREDGFHEVNTIMHALALHDTLAMRRFEEEPNGQGLVIRFRCETSGGIDPLEVPAEENIAYRAVVDLAHELGRSTDETIDMSLSKVIPAQAGLGGGSSNAAAALLGAAMLWGIDPDDERLRVVASRLGADVLFFLHGGCTRLSGKGETFEANLTPRRGFVLLVRPNSGVSTAQAYAAFDEKSEIPTDEYLAKLALYDTADKVPLWNNMTAAACAVAPEVGEVLDWAHGLPGSPAALLCGSGSAVAVLCDGFDDAVAYSVEADKRGWWTRATSFARVGASVVSAY